MRESLFFTGLIAAISISGAAVAVAGSNMAAVLPFPESSNVVAPGGNSPATKPAPLPSVLPTSVLPTAPVDFPTTGSVKPSPVESSTAPTVLNSPQVTPPTPEPTVEPEPSTTVPPTPQPCPIGLILDPVLGVCISI